MASAKSQHEAGFGIQGFLYGVVGLVVGAAFSNGLWGALSGATLGVLLAGLFATRAQLAALRATVAALELDQAELARRQATAAGPAPDVAEPRPEPEGESPAAGTVPEPPETIPDSDEPQPVAASRPDSLSDAVEEAFARRRTPEAAHADADADAPIESPAASAGRGNDPFSGALAWLRDFFFGGNTVVRVGLLVLLVGITLLAKYAADNALFPVEARLGAAALIGLGLVVLGYRQREARPGFGLSLQGGGVAALYLVTFFAYRTYELLPSGLAFGFFVALAISAALLAVLQRSQPLLVIGSLGGFLAPVLASTGSGDHVALFSYYLVLIASVAAVALRQAWRIPSLVAFFCTYGVAVAWGVLRYEPELFASTQPFVLAFMALFTAIAVLHAWRRPPQLRGLVDGTLVFGTPLVSIGIQSALVRDFELGLALSAAGFGLFYAALAVFLWRRGPSALRALAEAFVALAVGFATMAIPFAFDEALTTSVAWALEGAGLYWIGTRQQRLLPRLSGLALQLLAAGAVWVRLAFDSVDSSGFVPIANGRALSCLALAWAGLFVARQGFVHRDGLRAFERPIAQAFGVWGLVWWTGGSLVEIGQFVDDAWVPATIVAWIAATAFALELGAARAGWQPGRRMALASLPAAAIALPACLDAVPHLLADGGWLAWPLVFVVFHFLWERLADAEPFWLGAFRSGALWLLVLVAAFAAGGVVHVAAGLSNDWSQAAFAAAWAGVLLAGLKLHAEARSPFARQAETALAIGLGPVAVGGLVTMLVLQLSARGDAAPLPHVPLLNPVDVALAGLAIAFLEWWRRMLVTRGDELDEGIRRAVLIAGVAIGFAWLNGVLARAVHQWTGVAFRPDALWESVSMQVSLSIAWTLVGLVGMLLASRRGGRELWMGCAALLGVVVVKLFTVDLSQLSTVARIGTFLAVGLLLLVLGYLSPVPPAADEVREDRAGAGGDEPIPALGEGS